MQAVAEQSQSPRGPFGGARAQVWVTVVALAVRSGRVVCLLETSGSAPPDEGIAGAALPVTTPLPAETLEEAARRVLAGHGLTGGHLEQLRAWAPAAPGGVERVLEIGYLYLTRCPAGAPQEAPGAAWWPVVALPALAPAHAAALAHATQDLRTRLPRTNLAWSLLPEEFSLSELQTVYEAVEQRGLDKRNFRKWVLANGLVEPTPRQRREGAHRPARLYRFTPGARPSLVPSP